MTVRRVVSWSAAVLLAAVAWYALPRAHARTQSSDTSRLHNHDEPGPGPGNPQRISTGVGTAGGGALERGSLLPPVLTSVPRARVRAMPDGVGALSVATFPPATPARPRGPPTLVI